MWDPRSLKTFKSKTTFKLWENEFFRLWMSRETKELWNNGNSSHFSNFTKMNSFDAECIVRLIVFETISNFGKMNSWIFYSKRKVTFTKLNKPLTGRSYEIAVCCQMQFRGIGREGAGEALTSNKFEWVLKLLENEFIVLWTICETKDL